MAGYRDARALVTGGSRGIGEAIVDELDAAGATAVVLDLDPPGKPGRRHVRCDVREEASVVEAVGAAVGEMGGLDYAFLNAGVGALSPILEMSAAEWDEVQSVNLRGVFLTLRECARAMQGSGGSIVATGSVSGFLADRRMAHYNSSKAGLASLVRVAAAELGPQGIRVNALAPGTTDTPLFATTDALPGYRQSMERRTPLGRIGTSAEVARAAVELAGLGWVTGAVLVADGGISLYSPLDVEEHLPTS